MDYKDFFEFQGIATEAHVEVKNEEKMDLASRRRLSAYQLRITRAITGMNRKEFSAWLGIPYRTYLDWEREAALVPPYVLHLIAYKVKAEKEKGNL